MKIKLENAIEILKDVIKTNNQKKKDIEEKAKLEAAKIEAEATLVRAEAKAEAKRKQIRVLGQKGYLQIQMIEGLKSLQDGNHLIILDPNKTNPLPFLNLTQK